MTKKNNAEQDPQMVDQSKVSTLRTMEKAKPSLPDYRLIFQ